MARYQWDKFTERTVENGIDRGVLFPYNGGGVVWNGLTSFNETARDEDEVTINYYEGIPSNFFTIRTPRDVSISSYTYPNALNGMMGVSYDEFGVGYADQQTNAFCSFTFRTMKYNSDGYKIHIFVNMIPKESDLVYNTINGSAEYTQFTWTFKGIPVYENGRLFNHLIIDSDKVVNKEFLEQFENELYSAGNYFSSIYNWLLLFNWIKISEKDGVWELLGRERNITRNKEDGSFTLRKINSTTTNGQFKAHDDMEGPPWVRFTD